MTENRSQNLPSQSDQAPILEFGKGKHFPPIRPSLPFKLASCLLVYAGVTPTILTFMHLLNRTRVIGKENISRLEPPWILASNHITLLDDLFLGPVVFFPRAYRGYHLIPYHAPEERNFYKIPIIAWFMRQTKSIPLVRGQGLKQIGMDRLIRAVNDGGVLHIYPEGTRTRSGEIGEAKPGIGRIVAETGATVVPMYHQGLENILPIGAGIPRIGREIRISIGKPMKFDKTSENGTNPKVWKSISEQVIDAIKLERNRMSDKWGERPVRVRQLK